MSDLDSINYDELLDQVRGKSKPEDNSIAQATLNAASINNTDEFAQKRQLSQQIKEAFGEDWSPLAINVQSAQKRMDTYRRDEALKASPKLAEFAQRPGVADVVHDDIPNIGQIESSLKKLGVAGSDIVNRMAADVGDAAGFVQRTGSAIASSIPAFNEGAWGALRAGSELLPDFAARPLSKFFAEEGRASRATRESWMPKSDSLLGSSWYSGMQSLGLNVLQLPLGIGGKMGPVLTSMGVNTGGQAYGEARDKGVGKLDALIYGASQGAIEAGTEMIGMPALFGMLKPGKFSKKAAEYLLKDQGGEQIATAMQDLNEWAVLPENKDKSFSDYLNDRPNAAIQTALATAFGGGGQVALMKGLQYITQKSEESAKQAEVDAVTLSGLNDLSKASKVLMRDQQTIERFVESISEDGPVSHVYIDANTLMQTGLAEQIAEVSPSVASQIEDAIQTNGVVSIPVEEYVSKIAPTDSAKVLIDHLRTEADGFSLTEAMDYMQSDKAEAFHEEMNRVFEEKKDDDTFKESADVVRSEIKTQLDGLGRFDTKVNDVYSSLVSAHYAVTAAQIGTTPDALYKRFPINIKSSLNVGKNQQGQTLNQTEMPFDGSETARTPLPDGVAELDVDGVTRPALNSNGKPIHPTEEGVRNFWRWFGDSPNVDDDGFPIIFYHGGKSSFSQIQNSGRFGKGIFVRQGKPSGYGNTGYALYLRSPILEVEEIGDLLNDGDGASILEKLLPNADQDAINLVAEAIATDEHYPESQEVWDAIGAIDESDAQKEIQILRGKVARELGYQAVRQPDEFDGETVMVLDSPQIKSATGNRGTFDPENPNILYQSAGDFGAYHPPTNTITLLKGANLSTFIHELGHHFLEMRFSISSELEGQDQETLSRGEKQILNDTSALLKWFGIRDLQEWYGLDTEEMRSNHEKFARGFESYLFTGNAPSLELQGLFQRVRAWFMQIYKTLSSLNVEITPEVRGVFDRMLATNEEIRIAEQWRRMMPMFKTAEEAGMTPEEFESHHLDGIDATNESIQNLQAKSLRDTQWLGKAKGREISRLKRQSRELRAELQMESRKEVMSRPVYQAWQFLTAKPVDGGEPTGKLSIGALNAMYSPPVPEQAEIPLQFNDPQAVPTALQVLPDGKKKTRAEKRPRRNDLLAWIKKNGGITPSLASDAGGDHGYILNRMLPGIVRKNGFEDYDAIAYRLIEDGWIPDDSSSVDGQGSLSHESVQQAQEMVSNALRGEEVIHPAEELKLMEEAEEERARIEEVAREASIQNMSDIDATALAAEIDEDAVERAAIQYEGYDAAFMAEVWGIINGREQAGYEDEGSEAFGSGESNERAEESGGVLPEVPDRDIVSGLPETQTEQDGEGFRLDTQTQEELQLAELQRAEQEARAREEERLALQREQADSERDSFPLTGSARSADSNPNQGDIFPAPAQPVQNTDEFTEVAQSAPAPIPTNDAEVSAERIDDFGEKIGGARKDAFTSFKDDLGAVADEDIASLPLSKVWPHPDYQALIDNGADPWAVAFVRAARDEVPTKPRHPYKVRSWAGKVQTLRQMANDVMSEEASFREKAKELFNNSSILKPLRGRVELYMEVGHDKSLEGITMEHEFYSLYEGRENVSMWVISKPASSSSFGNWPRVLVSADTKEQAVAKFKSIHSSLGGTSDAKKTKFSVYRRASDKAIWVGKDVGRNPIFLAGPFDSVNDARSHIKSNHDELVSKLEKAKEIPRERRDINEPRIGEDMRSGQDVTPQMFSEAFGFRGVEFGNWVEQGRRQKDLNDAYDALMDMAAIIGIPPKAISLNGELSLAFGARGSGGKNAAAAHYENTKVVINLTKMSGAGSLGHEWWHALDNYFSRSRSKGSEYMTDAPDVLNASFGGRYTQQGMVRREMVEAFGGVLKAMRETGLKVRSNKLDAKRSKKYWSTDIETSARSFESYLLSKLEEKDASNDYLANIVAPETWKAAESMSFELGDSYPYILESELPGIRAAFDTFFETVKTRETEKGIELYQSGKGKPEPVQGNATDQEIISRLVAYKMVSKDGMHPDVVAGMFEFSSGDELVRSLASARSPKDEIDELTDSKMLQKYGELSSDKAIEEAADMAVHNEFRAKFLTTEANALSKATGKPRIMLKAAKAYAGEIVSRQKIRNIRPGQYTSAESRSAREAEKARKAGDIEASAQYKRSQVIQFCLAKAAYEAKDRVEAGLRYLKKFDGKNSGIDPEYIEQINALRERYDLRKRSDKSNDRAKSIRSWVMSRLANGEIPDIAETLLPIADRQRFIAEMAEVNDKGELVYGDDSERTRRLAEYLEASASTPYRDMTFIEFSGLVDTVKSIEHLGKLKNRLLTDEQNRQLNDIKNDIADGIRENAMRSGQNKPTRDDVMSRIGEGAGKFMAAHVRSSVRALVMDGGKDNGPVWRYFIKPANAAEEKQVGMNSDGTRKLNEILSPILEKVPARDRVLSGRRYKQLDASLNWTNKFAILLNVGNEGNAQRLLSGGVGGRVGLTMQDIMPILSEFSKDELLAAQSVWDMFESYRPELEALVLETNGKMPEWIPARQITIKSKDGELVTLRGGYFPVVYDPKKSTKAAEELEVTEATAMKAAARAHMTTRQTFLKQRVNEVHERPLLLTLDALYSGLGHVIHHIAFQRYAIDVSRLLKSKRIQDAMREHYGEESITQLRRFARDLIAGTENIDQGLNKAAAFVRQNVSLAGLGMNVVNWMQQPFGIANTVVRLGGGKEGAGWVLKGLVHFARNPAGSVKEAKESSAFLRNRAKTRFRDLNEIRNKVQVEGLREKAAPWMMAGMIKMQMIADVISWRAGYERAAFNDPLLSDAELSNIADQVVRDSQGGGELVDLSLIERGSPMQKLFTTFFNFQNTGTNLAYLSTHTHRSMGTRAADMIAVFTVPVLVGHLFKSVLVPGDGDDESWWVKLGKDQVGYLLGSLAFVRELQAASNELFGGGFGYQGPSGMRVFADAMRFAGQVRQGEFDTAFRKSAINLLGDTAGIPSAQINRTITGAAAMNDGETINPASLVFGFRSR